MRIQTLLLIAMAMVVAAWAWALFILWMPHEI